MKKLLLLVLLFSGEALLSTPIKSSSICNFPVRAYQGPWGFVPDYSSFLDWLVENKIGKKNSVRINANEYHTETKMIKFGDTKSKQTEICVEKCIRLNPNRGKNSRIDLSKRRILFWEDVNGAMIGFELVNPKGRLVLVSCNLSDAPVSINWIRFENGIRVWERAEGLFLADVRGNIFKNGKYDCVDECKFNPKESWLLHPELIPDDFADSNFHELFPRK
ncbi:hypothetical protein [Leptospira koniambonensis]|uniref:hypothetical protein n=1 Tax=Leptospira koniambonensis TaxID=2484950 RepID=UPI003EC0A2AD